MSVVLGGCSVYRTYKRPDVAVIDSLYRQQISPADSVASIADLSWKELFTDPHLQKLIETGLCNNSDLGIARLRAEEAEALLDTLKEQLEAAFEPIIDKVNSINEKELELMDKIGTMSELSEETQKSIGAEGFIRGIYYSNINDELFDFEIDENSPVASKEFSEKVFAEFIDYMQEYYKTLPMQTRKSNMLILLGSIPVAMDIADTIDYVKSSVENCIDEEQKILIVDKAGMVFDANGFSYADEDFDDDECGCDHDHHHHHHDHDCSCGHDHHHHDHDCECGHDHHHHDHDCGCGHDHH